MEVFEEKDNRKDMNSVVGLMSAEVKSSCFVVIFCSVYVYRYRINIIGTKRLKIFKHIRRGSSPRGIIFTFKRE